MIRHFPSKIDNSVVSKLYFQCVTKFKIKKISFHFRVFHTKTMTTCCIYVTWIKNNLYPLKLFILPLECYVATAIHAVWFG